LLLLALAGGAIQLVPDGTLLFHVALIAAMVALLNATLLKPISRILESREKRTKGRVAEAKTTLAVANEKLTDYESRLRAARAEGYALLEKERTAVSRERERKVAAIKAEVAEWLNDQKEQLRIAGEQIKATLKQDAKTIALQITQHILRREITQPPDGQKG
jgi:F0F1-type ATP synthase membrane subunit b/b'